MLGYITVDLLYSDVAHHIFLDIFWKVLMYIFTSVAYLFHHFHS